MNLSDVRPTTHKSVISLPDFHFRRVMIFGAIIVTAWIAFEAFNYSTTDYALRDVLGDLSFAGISWSTILAIAFCGIDFAGLARLFISEKNSEAPKEIWYLFAAWLLAATMNACLTWWGVSIAISDHVMRSSAVLDTSLLTRVVPVFVALMVWVIRILIIGTMVNASDLFLGESKSTPAANHFRPIPQAHVNAPVTMNAASLSSRPNMTRSAAPENSATRPEPTYHTMNSIHKTEENTPTMRM
jgi:hypothetical protein